MPNQDQIDVAQTEQPTLPPPPSLTLADLTLVLQTMQAMVERGAIKAEEMSTVGGLYDRLYKFLVSSGAIAPAVQTTPASPKGEPNA